MIDTSLELLQSSDFETLINQKISIRFSNTTKLQAIVEEVTEFCSYSTVERKPFSLVFSIPGRVNFPQSIYNIEHPVKGSLEVFLVPISATAIDTKYEAVFS